MEKARIAVPSLGEGGIEGLEKAREIKKVSTIANEEHVQGGCMVPVNLLTRHGVNVLIVGGIGMRPLMGFRQAGIEVYHDSTRPEIKPVVEDLIAGRLPLITENEVCGGGGAYA